MQGKKLSHFRLETQIGQGGMGLVYKAQDETLRRSVALKLLPPDLVCDEERRRRFLREAQAAAAVSHPAIAAIYEIGQEGEDVFIAMEYVEGRTLRSLLEKGPLSVAEALQIVSQIAQGLQHAHSSGVVHRDLKPENVMVGPEGRVKILDFGLAKLREERGQAGASMLSEADTRSGAKDLTREGAILGTVAYMSPEQARGRAVDARSDLFFLGVLLYELLTGRNPFRGETPLDTLSAVLKDRPAPASKIVPEVPRALDAMLVRLLAKEPAGRPASAAAVLEEIEALARASAAEANRGSIAVLPFADMSPQKDQDYFCEGIAEELSIALAHVEGLRVAARTSAFQFKGQADDVRRIGQQLGVATVLEGSVRKAGNRLRITAQLVSTADGYHLWSERYDRDMQDIFAIQDEIAGMIVETLKIRLVGEMPARRSTENVEAYQLYLQGRYWWNKRYEGGLWKGVEFFEQAITKDPGYARAHAGLADSYSVIGFYLFLPPRTAFARAKEASERALALDDALAEAHVARALVHFWFDWDWPGAEGEFRRAIALNPNHVAAHMFLGQMLPIVGRADEAAAHWARALELDPFAPLTHGIVGSGLYFARRYEAAAEECRKALELDPNHIQSLFAASFVYARLGRDEEAVAAARRTVELGGRSPFFVGVLGFVLANVGRHDEARALARELQERSGVEYVAPLLLGWIFTGLDDRPAALDWLEQAYEDRNASLFALVAWREYDRLRGEPRFEALARKLGLA